MPGDAPPQPIVGHQSSDTPPLPEATDLSESAKEAFFDHYCSSMNRTRPNDELVVNHRKHEENPNCPKRVICIAVDEGRDAEHAFNWALRNLVFPNGNDQICLLTVRPLPGKSNTLMANMSEASLAGTGRSGDLSEEDSALENQNREQSHQLLKKYSNLVIAKGASCVAFALKGSPKQEILCKVESMKPDMLVVGYVQ
ncbi:hypothetical protein HDU98_007167 [Podochytrium sp. JEL0797]|nr:hypothetical protein HDU98_007167 [Podochytrium sp. JEL0797]